MEPERTIFREWQPWRLNALLRWIMPAEAVLVTVLLGTIALNSPPGPDRLILLGVWLGLGVGLPLLFTLWGLRTTVTTTTLRVRFAGLPGWRIPLDLVESAEPRRVEPISAFGGWGWRLGRGYGHVLNVAGDGVVLVTLTDGRRRTVGSQRPDELAAAILSGAIGEPDAGVRPPVQSVEAGSSKA